MNQIFVCQVTGCIASAVGTVTVDEVARRLCERHRDRILSILEQPDRTRRAA